MERAGVLSAYGEGVAAIRSVVRGWPPERWREPACGDWTATDLAGHLLIVVGWYHSWLDRAETGEARPPFAAADLAERNRQALVGLRPRTGEDRIDLFVEQAERYALRLDSSWALPYGCPVGTMPAGCHAALAAAEWHLHAWDLSGGAHHPAEPAGLLVAVVRARAAGRGGTRAWLEAAAVPLGAWRRPWERLLEASGRTA